MKIADDRQGNLWWLGPLWAIVVLGSVLWLTGCATAERTPRVDPWPVKADGSRYARCDTLKSCCVTEGPIVLESWRLRRTWITYSCPEAGR